MFGIVFISNPILAAGPFDGDCKAKVEYSSCSPATLTFTVKENVINGTIKGEKGKGRIFSESPILPDGNGALVIGNKKKYPGKLHFSSDGKFDGTITANCGDGKVQGTCKK